MVTVGAIVTPNPTGALALLAGPLTAAVTFGLSASAGAPAGTYYSVLTYTAAGTESLPSQEYLFSVPAGQLPTVSVAAAGAPAGADHFAAYMSLLEGSEALQQATRTTTALGATFTAANPLTNSVGLNRCATNDNAGIAGLSLSDSAAVWATGVGGSVTAGGLANRLGYWINPPPLGPRDPVESLVLSLINGQEFEISLKQGYYGSLDGSTAGMLLDTSQQAAGVFIADTSQGNKVITILGRVATPYDTGPGDTGARVRATLNTGAI